MITKCWINLLKVKLEIFTKENNGSHQQSKYVAGAKVSNYLYSFETHSVSLNVVHLLLMLALLLECHRSWAHMIWRKGTSVAPLALALQSLWPVKHLPLESLHSLHLHHTHTRTHTRTHAHTHTHTRMHTQTHAYTHARVNTRTHTRTHTHTYRHTHTCIHTHIHTHTDTRIHAPTRARTHACTHAHTHIHAHTHTHTHTCMHKHKHTYTHTDTHTQTLQRFYALVCTGLNSLPS